MKLSKLLMFVALFTVTALSAKEIDPIIKSKLSAEIHFMIKDLKFEDMSKEKFFVNFIVNPQGEILVTSTSNQKIDDTIKSVLNYRKVKVEGITPYEVYTLPVSVK